MVLNDTVNLIGLKQDLYFQGKFSASTFSQLDLNRIINKYYKIAQEDIRAVNEDFFLVVAKADLALFSTNNGTYSFPLDYEKIKSYWAAMTPANISAPLTTEYVRCAVIDANAITDPSYIFTNPTIINFGSYFTLVPSLTDATKYPVIGGMKIYYIPVQVDLVNDVDIPNIFTDYHDVIIWGSLIDIAIRKGDDKLLTTATKKFKDRRAEMKQDAAGRVLDIENSYVEGQGTGADWAFPFGKKSL